MSRRLLLGVIALAVRSHGVTAIAVCALKQLQVIKLRAWVITIFFFERLQLLWLFGFSKLVRLPVVELHGDGVCSHTGEILRFPARHMRVCVTNARL